MARKFVRVGLLLLLLAGIVAVGTLVMASNPDSVSLDSFGVGILTLLSSILGFFGGAFFLAGLIGLAVNGGAEEPVARRVSAGAVCPECGETESKVGSFYCKNCGAQLQTD